MFAFPCWEYTADGLHVPSLHCELCMRDAMGLLGAWAPAVAVVTKWQRCRTQACLPTSTQYLTHSHRPIWLLVALEQCIHHGVRLLAALANHAGEQGFGVCRVAYAGAVFVRDVCVVPVTLYCCLGAMAGAAGVACPAALGHGRRCCECGGRCH